MLPAALFTFPDFTKRNEKKDFLSWNERINSSNPNSLALVRVPLCILMELKLESEWEIAAVFPFHTIIQKATFPHLTLITVTHIYRLQGSKGAEVVFQEFQVLLLYMCRLWKEFRSWNRPRAELTALMDLCHVFFLSFLSVFMIINPTQTSWKYQYQHVMRWLSGARRRSRLPGVQASEEKPGSWWQREFRDFKGKRTRKDI